MTGISCNELDNKDIILKIDFVCNVIRTAKICYFFTYIFFLSITP